jgi:hypothetical protein
MVHLVGSKPYFHSPGHFYEFLGSFMNSTCPTRGEVATTNITTLCGGTDPEAPCLLYEPNEGAAHFYPPGEHTLTFSDFRRDEFPYAFWSIQYVTLRKREPPPAAVVSVVSLFDDEPPLPAEVVLFNGIFWGIIVFCAVYHVSECCTACRWSCLDDRMVWSHTPFEGTC